jgi:NAD(P)-dependent dehydrogenase (short-subunit alcohol dehydrogenase family)
MAEGPVAIVTGAGSGIGRSAAVMLSGRGWRLVLAGRREERLAETAGMLAGPSAVVVADVGDLAEAAEVVDSALERFGRIDALINNAGWAPLAPIEKTGVEMLEEVFAVNALGPAAMISRAWPVFRAQKSGCVVNVSTMGTADPFPGFFAYAAAKAAVESMVRSCVVEGRKFGVRAFAVAPGAVETEMLRANFSEKALPSRKCLKAEDVAAVIVACVLGERDGESGKVIYLPSP